MLVKMIEKMAHHRNGFESLRIIQSLEKGIIPLTILQSILMGFFPYVELFITAYMIDAMLVRDFEKIPLWIIALIITNLVTGLLVDSLDKVNQYQVNRVQRKMRLLISKKTMELDYDMIEDAQILQKIADAEDAMVRQGGYYAFVSLYKKLLESVIKIVTAISMIVYLCFTAPNSDNMILNMLASPITTLSLFILLTVLNMVFNQWISVRSCAFSMELFENKKTVERRFDYYTDRVFLNYPMGKDIRLFNMFELIHSHYDRHMREASRFFDLFYYEKTKNKESGTLISNSVYMYAAYLIVVIKVLVRSVTVGELTKYIGAISVFNTAVVSMIHVSQRIKLQTEYVKVFNDLLNMESKKTAGTLKIIKRDDAVYNIEFHRVSFKYPNVDSYTLKDVSCKFEMEQKMALVGKNGAGKTTFIKLLCRLYEPTEGVITLNGVDIREYDYEDYLSLFSVVFQDFKLFAFPIRENVATNKKAQDDKVWECLSLSGIGETVKEMPHTIETHLYQYDKDGMEISGGEAQKIAIARALYKDAPFVILDEPTSALDPISEYEIYSKLKDLAKNKTSIFISHRMSSCRFCDDIIVLDEGQIVQRGNHETLIKEEAKLYASLYQAQAKYYIKETA